MSWRTVVIASNSKLDFQVGYLVVRNEKVTKVFLDEINTLIIESTAVSLTTYLLSELTKRKIKVIFCDDEHNPSSELIPYYGSHDTSNKIRTQIRWTDEKKMIIWTKIVTEKIRNQAKFLQECGKTEADLLFRYVDEIEYGDCTNREGHAAKVYFNALFGKSFSRSDDNSINAALNYGYQILLSSFNRVITSNGYLTQLGLFHDNIFNQFNLSSDLMEPFRILVDKKVYSLHLEKFDHDEKMEILNFLNDEVIIADRKEYVYNAIKIYCKSVFDTINNGDLAILRFYRNEL